VRSDSAADAHLGTLEHLEIAEAADVAVVVAPPDRLKARVTSSGHRLFWWVELVAIGVFYSTYSGIRNANEGSPTEAYRNAQTVIDIQRALGLFLEPRLQRWALEFKPLVIACNYFYGSLHFVLTIGIIVFLFRRHTDDYPLWRNTFAIMTGLALVGFVTFPLMPPRLLDGHAASFALTDVRFNFVDTLARYPTFWSFNSGTVSRVSNQFAAMPSLHFGWATWCAWAGAPRVRPRWAKIGLHAYPWVTLTAIVLTGNHYVLDAVGGGAIFLVAYALSRRFTTAGPASSPERPAGRSSRRLGRVSGS
jgi:PAP2 superfamily